jgi:hypothetical protein
MGDQRLADPPATVSPAPDDGRRAQQQIQFRGARVVPSPITAEVDPVRPGPLEHSARLPSLPVCNRTVVEQIQTEWLKGPSRLKERAKRRWAGARGEGLGSGGITVVARATDLSRDTIRRGIRELHEPTDDGMAGRERLPGGGRKSLIEADSGLVAALEALIEPLTGASSAALRWTCQSTRSLAEDLSLQTR